MALAAAGKACVSDQCIGLHIGQQLITADQIMRLATGQMETDRIAKRIDQGMDLGAAE